MIHKNRFVEKFLSQPFGNWNYSFTSSEQIVRTIDVSNAAMCSFYRTSFKIYVGRVSLKEEIQKMLFPSYALTYL